MQFNSRYCQMCGMITKEWRYFNCHTSELCDRSVGPLKQDGSKSNHIRTWKVRERERGSWLTNNGRHPLMKFGMIHIKKVLGTKKAIVCCRTRDIGQSMYVYKTTCIENQFAVLSRSFQHSHPPFGDPFAR